MNNSFLGSPSKLFATSIFLALSLGTTAAFSGGEGQSKNEPLISTASVFPSSTARRSQNVEIAPSISPSALQEEKTSVIPLAEGQGSGREKLTISFCNGTPGNANFWSGDQKIGIISQGTMVELTGQESGEWIEAIALYWHSDRSAQQKGRYWLNRCWK